jgi:hypothetical protein
MPVKDKQVKKSASLILPELNDYVGNYPSCRASPVWRQEFP